MTDVLTVLLDSNNRHPLIESRLGPRVQHFSIKNECIRCIQNAIMTFRRIDLFLSSEDKLIIGNQLLLFHNIYFHVYYPTADDIPNNNMSNVWVQVFEENNLWFQISYAIYEQDWTRFIESNYSREAHTILQSTHNIILEEVRAAKLGVQATS